MNIKLKCLLLDDELPGLTYLRMLCERIPGLEVVRAFNDPEKLIEASSDLDFDLCITDIEMPGLNGLEIARLLDGKPVIFITAYKEFAAEAFDLDAVDYIRKPIQKERLEKAVFKAASLIENMKNHRHFMQLNMNKGKALLAFDQILLITSAEKDKRDKLAYMDNGQEITLKNISFEQLLLLLPADGFCRVSKKDIIALRAIRFFNHQEINTTIPAGDSEKEIVVTIGENFRKDFLDRVTA